MRTVKNIMTADVAWCTRDASLQEVAQEMVKHDCGEIPVINDATDRRPIGVITDRDIACRTVAQGINPLTLDAESCMSHPVITVSSDATLEECARLMEDCQVRRLPVVDKEGRLCGIVSMGDFVRVEGGRELIVDVAIKVCEPAVKASQVAA